MNDGGSAFPTKGGTVRGVTNVGEFCESPGMTLRDYFAAKFAAAWVIALGSRWQESGYSDTDNMREANRRGLEQADAMLKARESNG